MENMMDKSLKRSACSISHILDYKIPTNRIKCLCSRKESQFVPHVFNILTGDKEIACPNCCREHFSKDVSALLVSLNYLAHIGVCGRIASQNDSSELVLKASSTHRLCQIVDTFRWNFNLIPFEISGAIVNITFEQLDQTKRSWGDDTDRRVTFVAASWGMDYNRGVTLYAKNIAVEKSE
ncbi:hypothetical protein V1264_006751 [Littorina saxatilis]|uniref:Uncharacterized protein n=1 Tax=Littorina saxatilis TaxID=31220 RepID=A0AAN9G4L3_9CAEN